MLFRSSWELAETQLIHGKNPIQHQCYFRSKNVYLNWCDYSHKKGKSEFRLLNVYVGCAFNDTSQYNILNQNILTDNFLAQNNQSRLHATPSHIGMIVYHQDMWRFNKDQQEILKSCKEANFFTMEKFNIEHLKPLETWHCRHTGFAS